MVQLHHVFYCIMHKSTKQIAGPERCKHLEVRRHGTV